MSQRANILAKDGGQFGWFAKIGATPEAVNVLNDQPVLFTILIVVLLAIILQCVLIWYIHYATMKPGQKKKKEPKKPAVEKPPAKVLPFLRSQQAVQARTEQMRKHYTIPIPTHLPSFLSRSSKTNKHLKLSRTDSIASTTSSMVGLKGAAGEFAGVEKLEL
ncbi:hypothetical protein GE09DRAFT_1211119 [Coniochaeta sp. 2T2.1]|nr:hypothetical protein GE09DRAFT_1211119 [Coniochaeta sp. 2T2.1]